MLLDDTQVMEQALAVQEPEAPDNVAEVQQEQPKPAAVEQPQLTQREMNMRKAWEKAEAMERERNEALRRLQELQNAQSPVQKSESTDEDVVIGQDEIAEGKHLIKLTQKIKKLEQQIQESKQQSHEMSAEARLKAQYPDFDKVVSRENIELLRQQYPELASTLHANSDVYNKAVSAYTLIKKFGIHQEDLYEADRARVKENASKPRPLASVSPQQGASPLHQANAFANGLTPELQSQLLKEMAAARKGY